MNGGQVEQIGSPREIYTRPSTAFVADFIGSLNVLELKVDELVGAYAVTRLDDGERVVVAAEPGTSVGDEVRVAMRPEQVQLSPAAAASPDGGSFLRGRIAEVVFLGMYTQFHVDTRAGRVISHRMADEPLAELEPGADVVLEWQPEDAALV
jgi:spermidine/putrescine transport system ATP-binding protein